MVTLYVLVYAGTMALLPQEHTMLVGPKGKGDNSYSMQSLAILETTIFVHLK